MSNTFGLEKFDNLFSLVGYFKDNQTCKDFLINQRWQDGAYICPYCGHHHCYRRGDGNFRCPNCLKNFSVLVGTIFENTKISLVKWFIAMYLISSSHKKGISSHQLSRDIAVNTQSVVNHGAKQYVDGDAHTNTIGGFWSQLKRSIFCIYHFVSSKYLQRYVDEAVFRYNTCKQNESDRFKVMFLKYIGVVNYDEVRNIA